MLNAAQTAWISLPGIWLSTAEIGADGTVWGVGIQRFGRGSLWAYVNGAWALMTTTVLPSNLTVSSAKNVWGVTPGGILEQWNGSALVALSPAPPFTPSHAANAIAAVGETSLTVLDTTGHMHFSSDAGATWSTIADTASSIAGGGTFIFVLDSSGASYHVNLLVPALTVTTSGGTTVCPGCPPGGGSAFHTVNATASFGGAGGLHGTAGVTTSASTAVGRPSDFVTTSATEIGSRCDPFGYLTAACQPSNWGTAFCSIGGLLFSGGGGVPGWKAGLAVTRTSWTGTVFNPCDAQKCEFQVINFCTDATTPPDLDMNDLLIGDMPVNFPPVPGNPPYYWDVYGACFRWSSTSPWLCTHALAVRYITPVPLGICTKRP